MKSARKHIEKRKGVANEEQEKTWYSWCVSEVEDRTDAIVAGKYRESYYKAAYLLVAIAEMRQSRGEERPLDIIKSYASKYPRHTAFRGELRSIVAAAKLAGVKV